MINLLNYKLWNSSSKAFPEPGKKPTKDTQDINTWYELTAPSNFHNSGFGLPFEATPGELAAHSSIISR